MAVMMVAARGLSTAQFAVLACGLAVGTVLTAAFDLGSQMLLTRDGVAGPPARGGLLRVLAIARLPLLGLALALAAIVGLVVGRSLEALATVLVGAAGAAQLSLTGALRSAQDLRPEALGKLACGVLTLIASTACMLAVPRAAAVLLVVAAANIVALVPMIRAARGVIARGPACRAWVALRRAAPLGAMALATLVYYRSGTIALSLFSSSAQTARFAGASTLAWGLLSVANAVTTGLLPRLAAANALDLAAATRQALLWVTALAVGLAGAVGVFARPLLSLLLGARYASASVLMLLCAATVLIAPAGVLGTALIAARRIRPVAVQVAVSLGLNLLALALLVPRLGAVGAAVATLVCETAALALLTVGALRYLPDLFGPGGHRREPTDCLVVEVTT
jgi:O-antigen/teichoic acid export membrane protein